VNVEDSIWDKLTRLVVGLLLIAGLVAIGVWYLPLIRQNENYRKEVLRLDGEVAKEVEARRHLTAQVDALNNDTNAIVRIARESLGVAKPGETVIRFEENSPTNAASVRN
jgi:cell division protein FtsB